MVSFPMVYVCCKALLLLGKIKHLALNGPCEAWKWQTLNGSTLGVEVWLLPVGGISMGPPRRAPVSYREWCMASIRH